MTSRSDSEVVIDPMNVPRAGYPEIYPPSQKRETQGYTSVNVGQILQHK